MSVTMSVFVEEARVPTAIKWADAVRASGFDMDLDCDFDVHSFGEFLPCTYAGEDGGFEYFWEATSELELEDEVAKKVGCRDVVISLITEADMRGLMTSTIAGAVLCVLTDGVLWDTEANELIPAADVLRWARDMETRIKKEL
jgi:hypothetical protein